MSTQSDKWHATRKSRMDELFSGKHYDIVSEDILDEPLETPLGYKTKKGYWLQDQNSDRIWVGESLLNTLSEDYKAVTRPAPKKKGRPRKQPIDQAQVWASRDIPNDAEQITQAGPTYINPNENQEA